MRLFPACFEDEPLLARRSPQAEPGTGGRRLFCALLALFVWLPLPLGSNRPWAWAIMEGWVYALAAAWLWGCARGAHTTTPAFERARPVLWLLGIWLAYGLLQLVPLPHALLARLSPEAARIYAQTQAALGGGEAGPFWAVTLDVHASVASWLKSLAYVLVFALTLLLVDRRARLRQLAYVLVLTGVFQASLASAMALGRWDLGFSPNLDVAHGTFVNPNHLAGFLVMNLSLGIGLLLASLKPGAYSGSRRQRLRSLVRLLLSAKLRLRLYLAVMVIALVLTHSRMGNTAFFVSLLTAGVLALILFKQTPRPTVLLISSLIVIDLLVLGAWFGVDRVVERIEQTRLATETRDQVDDYALRLWRDFPVLGTGMGTFYTVFPRYRGADVGAFFDHAHNDYLEILSEAGFVGFSLLAAVVVLSLRAALQAQSRRHDPMMRGMAFGATMAMVGMLIHSSVDFNLQIPANAAWFMAILAVSWLALAVRSSARADDVGAELRREIVPGLQSCGAPAFAPRHRRLAAALSAMWVCTTSTAASSGTVADLLHQANRLELAHRASDPGADEVIDTYRRVLALDSKNEGARQALAGIAVRCAALVEHAEALEQSERARQAADRIERRLADTAWRVQFLADKGNAEAEMAMGVLRRRGILFAKSVESACDFYRRAARADQTAAQYRYGLCIADKDRGRAISWIRKAAEQGHPAAQHLLGETYLGAEGKPAGQGAHWVTLAAEQGRPSAQSLLGWLYATGTGVPKDINEAFRLYSAAAKAGVPSAQNNLAELYETGDAGSRDEARAAYWYRRAAETGFPPAEFNLGRLYAEGKGVPRDENQARAWLRRARERGIGDAGRLLGWLDHR